MDRGDLGLVLGLAGFLLGGAAIFMAGSARHDADDRKHESEFDKDAIEGVVNRVEGLDRSLKDLTRRVNGIDVNPRPLQDRIVELEARVAKLETGGLAAGSAAGGDVNGGGTSTSPELSQVAFDALRKKVFDGDATDDEEEQFWDAAKSRGDLLKGVLSDLENRVKESPRDIEARMNLARGYITKLLTVPDGPERGLWSMKAVGQWTEVVKIDPNNWGAHSALGSNYSFWPEQFNKRPDAIKEFETARRIQENSTPEPKHASTYLQLNLLYKKDGRTDDAKAVLEEGLRRFPDDEELKKLRDGAR